MGVSKLRANILQNRMWKRLVSKQNILFSEQIYQHREMLKLLCPTGKMNILCSYKQASTKRQVWVVRYMSKTPYLSSFVCENSNQDITSPNPEPFWNWLVFNYLIASSAESLEAWLNLINLGIIFQGSRKGTSQ